MKRSDIILIVIGAIGLIYLIGYGASKAAQQTREDVNSTFEQQKEECHRGNGVLIKNNGWGWKCEFNISK